MTDVPQFDGWASAQVPRLVKGPVLGDRPASPAQKAREAEQLRAAVEAHLAAGGAYQVVPSGGALSRGNG